MIFTFLFIIRVCPTAGSSVVGNNVNDRLRVTPVVAGLLAITILSAVAAAAVMCALRVRSRRHTNQRRQDMCGIGTGSIMGSGVGGGAAVIAVCKQKTDEDDYAAAASDPDKNPDLIPPTKVKSKCATVFFFLAPKVDAAIDYVAESDYLFCPDGGKYQFLAAHFVGENTVFRPQHSAK